MPANILDAGATAVLGFVAVALVLGVLALLKRKNGNGNGHTNGLPRNVAEQVLSGISHVEQFGIEMPEPWRKWVRVEIMHVLSGQRLRSGVLEMLIRDGKYDEAASLVKALDAESEGRHGGKT